MDSNPEYISKKSSLEFVDNSANNAAGDINLEQYNHLFMQSPGDHTAAMIDPSPLINHDADGAAGLSEQELTGLPERENSQGSARSWNHPVQSTKDYLNEISTYFTPKFLSWMAISQFCVNGGIFTLVMSLSLPIFKQMGVSASRQQLYTTMVSASCNVLIIVFFLQMITNRLAYIDDESLGDEAIYWSCQ